MTASGFAKMTSLEGAGVANASVVRCVADTFVVMVAVEDVRVGDVNEVPIDVIVVGEVDETEEVVAGVDDEMVSNVVVSTSASVEGGGVDKADVDTDVVVIAAEDVLVGDVGVEVPIDVVVRIMRSSSKDTEMPKKVVISITVTSRDAS